MSTGPAARAGPCPTTATYRCADGEWLFLGAFTNAFIERGLAAAGAGWILLDDPRVGGPERPAQARRT